jgi:predicted nucleic acid-binding protein
MALFEQVPVVPFDRGAAVRMSRVPLNAGRRIDIFIAAHALALHAVMVTADSRFPLLDGATVYQLDDIELKGLWP